MRKIILASDKIHRKTLPEILKIVELEGYAIDGEDGLQIIEIKSNSVKELKNKFGFFEIGESLYRFVDVNGDGDLQLLSVQTNGSFMPVASLYK